MLIVGYEVNDKKNKNHYLVFGMDKVVGTFEKLSTVISATNFSARVCQRD